MASRRAGAHTRKQSLEAERLASFLVPLDVDKALRSSSYIIQTLLLFNTNKLIHHLSISSSRIEHPKAFPFLSVPSSLFMTVVPLVDFQLGSSMEFLPLPYAYASIAQACVSCFPIALPLV
jgi:hypothetical protein